MAGLQTIDKRSKVPKEAIQEVVEQIKSKFRPKKIILFGSYAYGTPRPESDVDLLVVMPLKKKPSQQALEILQNTEHHFGLEIIVKSPEELEKRLKSGDFLLQEAVEKGIVLYETDS